MYTEMSYTVGLDFGTHQTKICIQDASNPAQKIYEFFDFEMPNGNNSIFLPSIVQINEDDTLSYGFIDEKRCKTMPNSKTEKPVLNLPQKPTLSLPPKPTIIPIPNKPIKTSPRGASLQEQIQYQKNYPFIIEKWESDCKLIVVKNKELIETWKLDCLSIENDYNYDCDEYETEVKRLTKVHFEKLAKWEIDNLPQKQIFRYFKLAAFTNQFWEFKINPNIVSVWYLTFIIFKLQEKLGNDFYTQMGVPFNINKYQTENQKTIAYKILISANMLFSEYQSLDDFLKAKYTDLIENTLFFEYNDDDINEYGLNVLPEAFAGLSSITQQGRLTRGMHLLVDIGGGTTDIAFFTITDNGLPDIHAVESFPQGLNFIFEEYAKIHSVPIYEAQELFRVNQDNFKNAILLFHKNLEAITKSIINRIEKEFLNRKHIHNKAISDLRKAIANKPVVYGGGGSTYNCMRISFTYFTDVRLIKKDLLNIPYIKNNNIDESLFTILATSYGLSIPLESEIEMTLIENVFDHLPGTSNENRLSGKYNSDYEHGISDT
jgi:hypothetical protein